MIALLPYGNILVNYMIHTLPQTRQLHPEPVVNLLIEKIDPIRLEEMTKVSLLKRVDTKYLLSTMQLYGVLSYLKDYYRVLSVNGTRLNRYQNLYFDTPDFRFYREHHNGALNRYKIRCRQYLESSLFFLEVKYKTNKRKTIKSRIPIPNMITQFDNRTDDFIRTYSPLEAYQLEPKLWNSYSRITLVSKHNLERLTIDINLEFFYGDQSVKLPGIAIAEVKQEKFSFQSDFIQQMRAIKIRPVSFSKYCMGIATMYPHLKHNNFKPNFLLINKINNTQ